VSGVVVACPCGEVYELRVEYAGRLLECPVCGRHLRAGPAPGAPHLRPADLDPAFDHDVFLLQEQVLTIRSKYEVLTEHGTPILYVERPTYPVRTLLAFGVAGLAALVVLGLFGEMAERPYGAYARDIVGVLLTLVGWVAAVATFFVVSGSARPKRHVAVYRDPSRREVLLRVFQDQRLALVVRTYTVTTAAGVGLARLRKNYLQSLVRKRWDIESPAGLRLATAVEDSVVLSLLRRLLGPLFGLLRTNFVIVDAGGPETGTVLGEFSRKLTLLDRYVLDLRDDADRRLDRRVALALGVMLDTGERR
jgi:hypothetical protein